MLNAANPITSMLRRHDLGRDQLAKILDIDVCYIDMLAKHGGDVPPDVLKSLELWIAERRDWRDDDQTS